MRALTLIAVVTFVAVFVLLFHEAVGMDHSARQWTVLVLQASPFVAFSALMVTVAFAIGHTIAALALPSRSARWTVMALGVALTSGFFALVITGIVPIPGAEH